MSEVTIAAIQSQIVTLPNRLPFMVAPVLAEIYETRTDAITQAVKRHPDRFPEDFAFRLTREEADADMVAISKDEYIDLLKAKLALVGPRKSERKPARPMTPAEATEILRLRAQGWSVAKIAEHLGRNNSVIWAILHAQGKGAGNA